MRKLLGELIDAGDLELQTGPFGTQLPASCYVEEGNPVINVRNIGYAELVEEKLEFVPDEVMRRLSQHILKANDIVFGRKGAVDRHLYVKPEVDGWMQGGDCIRLRSLTAKVNMRYLSYSFLSEYHKKWMLNQGGNKATMAALNHDVIRRIEVELPKRTVQDDIASMLSAYDDLIENNRKRIKLLERAARLLYREWFVRLRFPGHEGVKLVKSEQGSIPSTWKITPLGELCTKIGSGSTPRGGEAAYKEEGVTLVRSQNVYDFAFTMDGLAYIDDEQAADLDGVTLQANDILLNITGASVGRCCMMPSRLLPGRVNQHVMIIRPDGAKIWPAYVLCVLNSPVRKAQLLSLAQGKGATREALTKAAMEQFKIVLPEEQTWKAFAERVEPMFDLRETLEAQNAALTRARDLLLPRLMSGKVKV